MQLCVDSLAGTHEVAAVLAGLARAGDVIALAGDMGAGKTAFAQGFGRALGIEEPITSPTFTLVHSYPCPGRKLTVHHADLYRLDTIADVDELALDELAEFGGIVLIEWGDVAATTLGDHLEVRLSLDDEIDDELDDRGRLDDGGGALDDEGGVGETPDPDAGDADDQLEGFAPSGARRIEIHATGRSWAARWDRVVSGLEAFRC